MISEGATVVVNPSDGEDGSSGECSEDETFDGTVALRDNPQEELHSFGNISVLNSSDVHFGNKTFYQGPVTIKQFLYANGTPEKTDNSEIVLDARTIPNGVAIPNGVTNPVFIPDFPAVAKDGCDKPVTQESSVFFKGFQQLQKFSQQNVYILVSLLALVVVSLVILTTVLTLRHSTTSIPSVKSTNQQGESDEQEITKPIDAPLDPNANLTLPGKLKLVTRLEWLAQPPVEPANHLPVPVPYVIIHHTATENCSSQAQCRLHVRFIQMFHVESRGWWDIGYNFLVGGDGEAYEGRGWTAEGAHLYGFNDKSIGIAFIGTFMNIVPPKIQITACKLLIAKGVKSGYIKKDYKLLAARQLQTTQSPGALLYEEMKSWDHWATEP